MSRRRWLIVLLGLLLTAGSALAEGELLQPRRLDPVAMPGPRAAGPLGPATLALAGLLAGAGVWWWWREWRAGGGRRAGERHLAIVESRPLGNRQHLVVADYAGRRFLLGVCPGRIDLLAPLDSPGAPPPP